MIKHFLCAALLTATPFVTCAADNDALAAENARAKAQLHAEAAELQARVAAEKARDTQAAPGAVNHAQWRAVTGAYAAAAAAPAQPARKITVPYVGVGSSEVPPALAYHLKLPTGSGLVVDWVAPASPAEAAGLKLYDVVTQIDDQRLVNPEQLRTLVRLRKPGDPATFTVIRQGQPTTVTLKLTQTEVDEFAATTAGHTATFQRTAPAAAWQVMPAIPAPPMTPGLPVQLEVQPHVVYTRPLPADAGARAAERFEVYRATAATPAAPRPRVLTSTQGNTLLLARFENAKPTHLLAIDTSTGKTLFDGAVGTEDQRKAFPPGVAAALDTLEKNQQAAPEFGTVGR
ncbi:MAG: S1C family serine protease [Phycisphaerae bacterium]